MVLHNKPIKIEKSCSVIAEEKSGRHFQAWLKTKGDFVTFESSQQEGETEMYKTWKLIPHQKTPRKQTMAGAEVYVRKLSFATSLTHNSRVLNSSEVEYLSRRHQKFKQRNRRLLVSTFAPVELNFRIPGNFFAYH